MSMAAPPQTVRPHSCALLEVCNYFSVANLPAVAAAMSRGGGEDGGELEMPALDSGGVGDYMRSCFFAGGVA